MCLRKICDTMRGKKEFTFFSFQLQMQYSSRIINTSKRNLFSLCEFFHSKIYITKRLFLRTPKRGKKVNFFLWHIFIFPELKFHLLEHHSCARKTESIASSYVIKIGRYLVTDLILKNSNSRGSFVCLSLLAYLKRKYPPSLFLSLSISVETDQGQVFLLRT